MHLCCARLYVRCVETVTQTKGQTKQRSARGAREAAEHPVAGTLNHTVNTMKTTQTTKATSTKTSTPAQAVLPAASAPVEKKANLGAQGLARWALGLPAASAPVEKKAPAPVIEATAEAKKAKGPKKAKRSYIQKLGALLTRNIKQTMRVANALRGSDNAHAVEAGIRFAEAAAALGQAQEWLIELPGDFKPAKGAKGEGLGGKKVYEPGDRIEIKAKHAALYEIEPGVLLVVKMAGEKRVVVTDSESVRHSLHTAHVLPEGVEAKRAAAKAERAAKKATEGAATKAG